MTAEIEIMSSHLLNEREAAQFLGCSVALMRKMRLHGIGPDYCRVGRLVRYPQTALLGYIDATRVRGAV